MAILAQAGDREGLDPAVVDQIVAAPAPDWCGVAIPPSCLYDVVTIDEGRLTVLSGAEEIATFLGDLETLEEARLFLLMHDYFATGFPDPAGRVWRPVTVEGEDGYEIYVLKRTQVCEPIETRRYRLRVSRTGKITPLSDALWHWSDGCF